MMLNIYDFEVEYQKEPLGLDVRKPTFSWKLDSSNQNIVQKSYRLDVYAQKEKIWSSGIIESEQSLYIEYEGPELLAQCCYEVSLWVESSDGECAVADTHFEMGFLTYKNFEAEWITHAFEDDLESCAIFLHRFQTEKKVIRARAYISSLGIYEAHVNGHRLGDAYFTPGWTSYQERLQYQTYDITEFLLEENDIKITVGNGWFKGILGFYGQGNHYGKRTAVIAMVDLFFEDGSKKRIVTDEEWQCTIGENGYNDIYNGQVIDFTTTTNPVENVRLFEHRKDILVGQENEPIKITEKISAKKLHTAPNGEKIIDFGQNMTGIVELKIKRPRGTVITIKHGEMLDEKGNLFTTNLRTARATDVFITSGGDDTFLPSFTFHGFRYISIEGIENIDLNDFTACVMHSNLKQTGRFESSNEAINQLWHNIDWTMRSNYFDIPMDCPQRDERLGYTGDCEIFLPTACWQKNVALFYRKWLRDLRVEQSKEGAVYLTVPDILKTNTSVQIWHEAATIVPWHIWESYGDKRVLTEQYDSMKKSVEYTTSLASKDGILNSSNSSQFGDWLSLDAPKGPHRKIPEGILRPSSDEKVGSTDVYFLANIYYLYSIDIMVKTATILNKNEDKILFEKLYQNVLKNIRQEYVTANGRLVSETQTSLTMALYFNIIDDEKQRMETLERLVLNLVKNKKHLMTGFTGTEYIMKVLSQNGLHQLAGDILLKDDCPSWLYSVKLGATTIWELWDGVNPDGSINLFNMNSFNQYGFGTVGDWLYSELCGIKATSPAFKTFTLKPRPVNGISSYKVNYETPYGEIKCSISCKSGRLTADISVPTNTSADLTLPESKEIHLGSGTYHFEYNISETYEVKKFSEDTTLNELRSYPKAENIFMTEAPDLAKSGFVRGFAGRMSIIEIKKTLPKTLVPERAFSIFDKMIAVLNGE
ncbi:alpha-L-rhamnosidase [Streptococcus henryi]|uniref:alpha-L-rhamnosidase n=1 Tax=Streptococcus henryi TaxID=439219 RepID=UPI00035D5D00|nr:alpha-L-rhamnosidase [Streptococcus henryi]